MEMFLIKFVAIVIFVQTCIGSPILTCDGVNPTVQSNVTCSCISYGGAGIYWYRDDAYLTQCTISNQFCFAYPGYKFHVDSSTSTYTITFDSYSYTACSKMSCVNSSSSTVNDTTTIPVTDFRSSSTVHINEPHSNYTSGNINITTDCIYKADSTNIFTIIKWIAVEDGGEEHKLQPDHTISNTGSCQCCSEDYAAQLFVGFFHTEEANENKIQARIRLVIEHDGYPSSPPLDIMTKNFYYVKVGSKQVSDAWCIIYEGQVWCFTLTFAGIILVFVILQGCFFRKQQKVKPENRTCLVCICICVCIPFIGILIWFVCLFIEPCGDDRKDRLDIINVLKIEQTSVHLRWKRCCEIKTATKRYCLQYSKNDERNEETIVDENNRGTKIEFTLGNLRGSTEYELNLNCVDESLNVLKEYATRKVRTYGEPDPPTNLSAENIMEESMTVKWKKGFNGGYPQWFQVYDLDSDTPLTTIVNESNDGLHEYSLNGLTPSTFYRLKVSAGNKIGTVFSIDSLDRVTKGKPHSPKSFECVKNGIDIITVQWTAGLHGGHEQNFVLTIAGGGSSYCQTITDDGRKNPFRKEWHELDKSTHYEIALYAENEYGVSEKQVLDIMTYGNPESPTEFRLADVSINSITVTWKPGLNGGFKQTFYVEVNEEKHKVKSGDCEYICSDLTKGTYYNISLRAHNKYGDAYAANSLHVKTLGPPVSPTEFKMVANTESTITMKWKGGDNGGKSQHFILKDPESGKIFADDIPDEAERIYYTFFSIKNLPKGTKYKLQVLSKNKYGTSEPSSSVDVKTKGSPFPS